MQILTTIKLAPITIYGLQSVYFHTLSRPFIFHLLAAAVQPIRYYNHRAPAANRDQSSRVRVRFAPSPTGHIHLGGLRAALYNYIYARKHNGQFVLRIEDTDRARLVSGSAEAIERVLQWAGLEPDESPIKGGPYGPYEQSKRLSTYLEYANRLLIAGKAYRCFCSSVRLDLLRREQAKNREKARYDGKCKHLTATEIEEKLAETQGKCVIRFTLREGQNSFDDLVFGTITTNLVESLESDPIIIKSDGYPTYHFANVIDDHLMQISHVLRGSEWISSTAKHLQLYQALQWEAPQFMHLPLVTMHDGSKMSKRNDHSHVKSWIEAGYQPEALCNFLTNSGGGVPKLKQDSNELWTLRELIDKFDFSQITSHPASLDVNRLRIYSAKELQRTWALDRGSVMMRYRDMLTRRGIEPDIDDELAESIIGKLIERLTSIDDLLSHDYAHIWRQPLLDWTTREYADNGWNLIEIIEELGQLLTRETVLNDREKFTASLKDFAQTKQLDYSQFMRFLRKILTNSEKGLPVYEICACLGRDRLAVYLRNGLDHIRASK